MYSAYCILLYSVAWQPNFDKQISSQEKGGGVRGVEQWIRMANEYIIVTLYTPGYWGTRSCIV